MKMNNYSKFLTYLIVLSLIYCVFMITYSLSRSDNSEMLNDYIDVIKEQDKNIARLSDQILKTLKKILKKILFLQLIRFQNQ